MINGADFFLLFVDRIAPRLAQLVIKGPQRSSATPDVRLTCTHYSPEAQQTIDAEPSVNRPAAVGGLVTMRVKVQGGMMSVLTTRQNIVVHSLRDVRGKKKVSRRRWSAFPFVSRHIL